MKKIPETLDELVKAQQQLENKVSDLRWELSCLQDDIDDAESELEKVSGAIANVATPASDIVVDDSEALTDMRASEHQKDLLKKHYGSANPTISIADWWTL